MKIWWKYDVSNKYLIDIELFLQIARNAIKSENSPEHAVTWGMLTYQNVSIDWTHNLGKFGEDTTNQTWILALCVKISRKKHRGAPQIAGPPGILILQNVCFN